MRSRLSTHPDHLGTLHRVVLLSYNVVCDDLFQKYLDLFMLENVGLQDTVCDRWINRKPLLWTKLCEPPTRDEKGRLSALPHLTVPFRCGDVRVFCDDLFGWPRLHTCSIVHHSHTRTDI